MIKGCLLLAISSSWSWQKKISWRSVVMWVARRRFFASSATLLSESIISEALFLSVIPPSTLVQYEGCSAANAGIHASVQERLFLGVVHNCGCSCSEKRSD